MKIFFAGMARSYNPQLRIQAVVQEWAIPANILLNPEP
jgi:hypothetical protein